MNFGHQLQRKTSWIFYWAGLGLFVLGVLGGIFYGPPALMIIGALGVCLSGGCLYASFRKAGFPGPLYAGGMLTLHVGLLVAAVVLEMLFLTPLADSALKIPRFTQRYDDPQGLFTVYGPANWSISPFMTAMESGVHMTPPSRHEYNGVTELTVRVRVLEKAPASKKTFLKSLEKSLNPRNRDVSAGPKMFDFHSEPVRLIGNHDGLLTVLNVKRFWIPMQQLAVFGVKGKDALVSVSAVSLEAHATLAKPLCLGVMYKTEVHSLKSPSK